MKDRKILITGASGFIGGFLVEEALRRGYETWAGIRAGSSKAHLQDKRIHFIDLKYGDQEALDDCSWQISKMQLFSKSRPKKIEAIPTRESFACILP